MKLVIAIINDDDAIDLIDALTEKSFRVTKLATTGGFLKSGNTTLITGIEKDKIDEVIDIIKDVCKKRKEIITSSVPMTENNGMYMQYPIEVEVGGATVFVVDVDKFVKI